MSTELPQGKAAIIVWMKAASQAIPAESLRDAVEYVLATEYIIGLENLIGGIRDVGWPDSKIERLARQLAEACELVAGDPRPEYLSPGRINDFVEEFKAAAGYGRRD